MKIVDSTNPILRKKAKEVAKIDKKILKLIIDMKATVAVQKDPEGVGLAAPQVGKSLRIFVMNYGERLDAFINPKIVSKTKTPSAKRHPPNAKLPMEGCLSIPNYYGPLTRSGKLVLTYLSEKGEEKEEELEGFFAQIVEHEIDHLNGVLFTDRLLEQKQSLYKLVGETWQEVDF